MIFQMCLALSLTVNSKVGIGRDIFLLFRHRASVELQVSVSASRTREKKMQKTHALYNQSNENLMHVHARRVICRTDQQPQFTSNRPESFLRDEFARRLLTDAAGVQYTLQIQLYDCHEDGSSVSSKAPDAAGTASTTPIGGDWAAVSRSLFDPSTDWPHQPWLNVAQVYVGQLLPPNTTSFNVYRVPDSTLHLPEPFDAADFCSTPAIESQLAVNALASARSAAESATAVDGAGAPHLSLEPAAGPAYAGGLLLTDYLVHCVTGDCSNAGTASNVLISIVGKSGCIWPQYNTHIPFCSFARKQTAHCFV
jgi:hypothetical protein